MDKGRRNEIAQLKKVKRLRKHAACMNIYINSKGEKIFNPKVEDLKDWKFADKLKNHSTVCSCSMCSPYRYSRKQKHKNVLISH